MRLDLNPSPELRKAIDRWRGRQEDVPPASTAARRLIEWALAHYDTVSPQDTVDTPPTPNAVLPQIEQSTPNTGNTAASPLLSESAPEPVQIATPEPVTDWMKKPDPKPAHRPRSGSVREHDTDIVRLKAQGRTWAQIGAELNVSPPTIARALRAAKEVRNAT
jgi:hypothetical protein